MTMKPKNKFVVCDLSSIETRVAAWITGCTSLLNVFHEGRDPYLDFAEKMFGIPYAKLWADYKGLNGKDAQIAAKRMRQLAKPGVLGAVYRLGGGDWIQSRIGYIDHIEGCLKKKCDCPKVFDRIKGGMWGYSENMGVSMTQEEAHMVVRVFRQAYPEITEFWSHIEVMTKEVLDPEVKNVIRKVGPNGCIVLNRLNIEGRYPLFRMQLPSGRYLHYLDARIEETKMPWKDLSGEDVFCPALWYSGLNQVTKIWGPITSNGGKELENLTQGIARDVLVEKLLECDQSDLPIHLHVHDEGGAIVLDDPFSPGIDKMVEIFSKPISWAPGLPLAADGFEDFLYHK
jgi:DNA polymerase bacteriophage-type